MAIHDARVLSIEFARRGGFAVVDERRELEIFGPYVAAPASIRVFEVATTDERRIAAGLVRCEVSDESAVAERGGIAVEDEHAAAVTGDGKQVTGTPLAIDIAPERTG